MQWAAENDCVVLTNDLDFGAFLAATQGRRPSVLQLRSNLLTPDAMGAAVLAAIKPASQALIDGALISIEPDRARLRILPLVD
jgi:predicted nuclease of predicted toxin-antitoxin system